VPVWITRRRGALSAAQRDIGRIASDRDFVRGASLLLLTGGGNRRSARSSHNLLGQIGGFGLDQVRASPAARAPQFLS
jgi:hypothetical protein